MSARIQPSRVVKASDMVAHAPRVTLPSATPPGADGGEASALSRTHHGLAKRRAGRELAARELAGRILDDARRERHDEERTFAALLEARRLTIAADALKTVRADVVELAGLVAERLVGKLAEGHEEIIVRLVDEVVREARPTARAEVRVAEVHLGAVRSAIAAGVLSDTLVASADDTLRPGDVLLDLGPGRVDGRVALRVDALLRVLARHWQQSDALLGKSGS